MLAPPNQLFASLGTVAGCLAMIGPICSIAATHPTRDSASWVSDGGWPCRTDLRPRRLGPGELHSMYWATPLSYQPMGLTILAALISACCCTVRAGRDERDGLDLGLFWVAMAASTLLPARMLGL